MSYVKAGLAKEARYNVSNPFWLLGIPPKLASIPLVGVVLTVKILLFHTVCVSVQLAKAKRKLSLLLHPDKCLDSSLKPDAQIAFTAVRTFCRGALFFHVEYEKKVRGFCFWFRLLVR